VSGGYGSGGYPGQDYGDPGYEDNPKRTRPRRQGGYGGPAHDGQQYGGQQYQGQQQGQQYDGQAYGDYDGYADPRGYGQPAGGYDQRRDGGYQQGGYQQGGYDEWQQEQRDDSFLPGFGGRAQERDGRYGYDEGYGDRRAPRGADPGGRGPNGPSGRDDSRDWDERDYRPKPRKKVTRWFPRILVLCVVVAILAGALVGGLYIKGKFDSRYHPADYAGQGTGEVTVQVKSGDNAFTLAPRLLQLGVIASTRAFTNAAENAPATASSTGLEAGYYLLHSRMQASIAYADLLNPKNLVQTTVTIPEGKRAVDVIAIVAKRTKVPLKDFQQVLANPAQLGLPTYANGKVEGYLFPATYAIGPHETALQILQAMVQRFNEEAQAIGLEAAAASVHLTPAQLVTEASLAQAEGGSVSDYPKIAEVIHNRLAIGMHLQFDSTVLYGIGKYAVSATIKQTKTPGPYNTYLNAGLPPGPISNPGDAAIQGILHADHGNWLYFLTVPGGKSQFSATPLKGQ
jgi:UPF0755 protein